MLSQNVAARYFVPLTSLPVSSLVQLSFPSKTSFKSTNFLEVASTVVFESSKSDETSTSDEEKASVEDIEEKHTNE